jgi:hypothetical protein
VSGWLDSVARFESRILVDLPPELMRRLVEVYIHHLDKVDAMFPVCTACGLAPGKATDPGRIGDDR